MATITRVKQYALIMIFSLVAASVGEAAYQAPTPNLTTVANAITIKAKSVTTMVYVPPGLPITQPVEISVGFYSSVGANRVTQTYSPSFGNRLVANDAEGDGKARPVRVDVSLSEKPSGGARQNFSFGQTLTIEPLYNLAFGPLAFTLISPCDEVGKNEIYLTWSSPINSGGSLDFSLRTFDTKVINQFVGWGAEFKRSKPLRLPALAFEEQDFIYVDVYRRYTAGKGWNPESAGAVELGKTQVITRNLKDARKQCSAQYRYQVSSNLITYPSL